MFILPYYIPRSSKQKLPKSKNPKIQKNPKNRCHVTKASFVDMGRGGESNTLISQDDRVLQRVRKLQGLPSEGTLYCFFSYFSFLFVPLLLPSNSHSPILSVS